MSLPMLYELAKKAKDCTEWTQFCGAACCKNVVIQIIGINPRNYFKGKTLKLPDPGYDADFKRYLEYHDFRFENGFMLYKLWNFKLHGDHLIIHERCKQLTEDLRCGVQSNKPQACKDMTLESIKAGQTERFVVPSRCLYLLQSEEPTWQENNQKQQ